MNVVVTGGAGFIGANLCRRLVADGHEVVAYDDLSTGRRTNLDGVAVRLVEGSILDRDRLADVVHAAERVVHLAARPSVPRSLEDPDATHDVNATGTLAVLEAARRAGAVPVVVASSSSVYGRNPELPKHEGLVPEPMSPYAASKLAAEAYASAYQESFGLPVLVLRFFNVFGPLQPADHDYAAVVPAFVAAALAGRPVTIHGDGQQTRDFTFVGSVAEILATAVTKGVADDRPVNLAFGTRTDLLSLLTVLEGLLGAPIERHHVDARPGDVRHSQADDRRLRELFPDAEPVDLATGLRATVDWFRAER